MFLGTSWAIVVNIYTVFIKPLHLGNLAHDGSAHVEKTTEIGSICLMNSHLTSTKRKTKVRVESTSYFVSYLRLWPWHSGSYWELRMRAGNDTSIRNRVLTMKWTIHTSAYRFQLHQLGGPCWTVLGTHVVTRWKTKRFDPESSLLIVASYRYGHRSTIQEKRKMFTCFDSPHNENVRRSAFVHLVSGSSLENPNATPWTPPYCLLTRTSPCLGQDTRGEMK